VPAYRCKLTLKPSLSKIIQFKAVAVRLRPTELMMMLYSRERPDTLIDDAPGLNRTGVQMTERLNHHLLVNLTIPELEDAARAPSSRSPLPPPAPISSLASICDRQRTTSNEASLGAIRRCSC
jgi:hypothetical protein